MRIVPASAVALLLALGASSAAGQSRDAAQPVIQFKVLLDIDYVSGEPLPQPPNQGFGVRRSRVFAQLNPAHGLGFRVQFEPSALANGPLSAPPLRGVPLFEAYVDYVMAGAAVIRAGQQRVPFGLSSYQTAPSSPMIEFPQFTRYVVQRVDAFRDIGVTVGGRAGALEYATGVFNGAGVNAIADNDSTRDVAVRLAYAVLPGVQLGASGWRGHSGNLYTRTAGAEPIKAWYDKADFRRFSAELRLARGPLDILAEYDTERIEHNPAAQNPTPDNRTLRRAGYNIGGALKLNALSARLGRLQLVARHDWFDPHRSHANDEIREYAAGVNIQLLLQTQTADVRFGRALNEVQRSSRVMVFWEAARPKTGGIAPTAGAPLTHDSDRLHVRWELFY